MKKVREIGLLLVVFFLCLIVGAQRAAGQTMPLVTDEEEVRLGDSESYQYKLSRDGQTVSVWIPYQTNKELAGEIEQLSFASSAAKKVEHDRVRVKLYFDAAILEQTNQRSAEPTELTVTTKLTFKPNLLRQIDTTKEHKQVLKLQFPSRQQLEKERKKREATDYTASFWPLYFDMGRHNENSLKTYQKPQFSIKEVGAINVATQVEVERKNFNELGFDIDGLHFGEEYELFSSVPIIDIDYSNTQYGELTSIKFATAFEKLAPYRFSMSNPSQADVGIPQYEIGEFYFDRSGIPTTTPNKYEYMPEQPQYQPARQLDVEIDPTEGYGLAERYCYQIFQEDGYMYFDIFIDFFGRTNQPYTEQVDIFNQAAAFKKIDSQTGEELLGGKYTSLIATTYTPEQRKVGIGRTLLTTDEPYYLPYRSSLGNNIIPNKYLERESDSRPITASGAKITDDYRQLEGVYPYMGTAKAFPFETETSASASPYFTIRPETQAILLANVAIPFDVDEEVAFLFLHQIPELNYFVALEGVLIQTEAMANGGLTLKELEGVRLGLEDVLNQNREETGQWKWAANRHPIKNKPLIRFKSDGQVSEEWLKYDQEPQMFGYFPTPHGEPRYLQWLQEIQPPMGYKLPEKVLPFFAEIPALFDDPMITAYREHIGLNYLDPAKYGTSPTTHLPYIGIENEPDYFQIELQKTDVDGNPLKGAEFTLFQRLHGVEEEWTAVDPAPNQGNEQGVFTWTELMKALAKWNNGAGKEYEFKIEETKFPSGYIQKAPVYSFYFDYSNIDYTGQDIPNSKKVPELVVFKDGEEAVLGEDYTWDQEKGSFAFKIENEYDGALTLCKVDEDTNAPLGGAVFVLEYQDAQGDWQTIQQDGKNKEYTTNAAAEGGSFRLESAEISSLYDQYGRGGETPWRFKEIKAPDGYDLPEEAHDWYTAQFYLKANGIFTDASGNNPISELVKTNLRVVQNYELQLRKTDESGNLLNGAEFELTTADGSSPAVTSSGDQGHFSFTDLQPNVTYILKETKAPTGYEPLKDVYKVTWKVGKNAAGEEEKTLEVFYGDQLLVAGKDYMFDPDDEVPVLLLEVENKPGATITMPLTGGIGILSFLIGGAIVIGTAYNIQAGKLSGKSLKKSKK